ncbi:MAG: hypothetical protein Q7J85_07140 [Bacillota bacterium]|nr:hypothetical protein [Bacillota bacterium]
MGRYSGETYKILCSVKGINNNLNINAVEPDALIWPSKNIDLTKGGWGRRLGTAKINSTVITDAPRIMGIYDFLKIGGTQHIVFATSDGKIYRTPTITIKTGLGTSKYANFSMFNNVMFYCNGYNIPQTWDGSAASTSDLTTIPTDWTGTNYPSVMIRHGRGNSERMWAFGCPSTPYTIYVTPNGDGTDFSDANVVTFSIDTGDNAGIVGGVVYKDQLILFGKRNTFIMDDADTNTDNWGYSAFTREGGVAHQRLIIPTQNDIICMMEDGTIYSLAAAEQYGDYKAASITKAKFMDRWVQDNVRLSYIEHFHGIYDPVKKKVKIFVVRTGQTAVDTAMVYYVETGEWMIEDNVTYNSGYSASASELVKVSPGVYEVYTGDYSGFIWHLEQTAKNDASNGYESKALTPYLFFENARESKLFSRCWIDLEPDTTYNLNVRFYVDEIYARTVSMSGDVGALGSFVLGVNVIGTEQLTTVSFPLGVIGEKIQFEFTQSTADEDFFMSQLMIDFKPLGKRANR